MPDVPTEQGTDRLRRFRRDITESRHSQETDEVTSRFDGSTLADLVETIEAGHPDVDVWVGKAGETAAGEFVKIDGLAPAQVGFGMAVECWPDIRDRFQVAYYASDLAGAIAGRRSVGDTIAASGEWMLDVGSEQVLPDTSELPLLWIALFTVVRP